jgi:hypothetical protein
MEYSIFNPDSLLSLKYNVFAAPKTKPLLESLPELNKFESFTTPLRADLDKLIKFVVIMYDKKSPFTKVFQDVDLRKKECAAYAGYDLEKDKDILTGIFNFTDPEFAAMVIEFLKDQNSRVWSMIVSNEQTFYEFQKVLLTEVLATTDRDRLTAVAIKSKLMEESSNTSERIDKYYQMLFGSGEVAEHLNIDYSPEGQAKR